jgi:two-component sensor histidine kinase
MLLTKLTSIILPATPRHVAVTSMGCALAGALARASVDPLLPPGVPFPTFWVAADIATIVAGWRAGALTVAMGALMGWFFWMEPRFSFGLPPGGAFVIALFVVLAGLQVFLAELMREALLRAQRMREERDLVVRELVHRIRNHFALFNSIAMQTLRTSRDLPAASEALQGRLKALMMGLDIAAMTDAHAFELSELVNKVVLPLAPTPQRLLMETVSAQVPPEHVHAVALVLHELGTNAIKYGAWSGHDGVVRVGIAHEGDKVRLQWTEEGVCHPGTGSGFGSILIARAIPDAHVDVQPGPPYSVVLRL